MNVRTKVRFLSPLIVLAFACGQKTELSDSPERGTAKYANQNKSDESSNSLESVDSSFVKQDIAAPGEAAGESMPPAQESAEEIADAGASPTAVPPVPVGGAYLTCTVASNESQLACQVKDLLGKAVNVDKSLRIDFAFVPLVALLGEEPTTFTAFDTKNAGTFFYVDNKKQNRGQLQMRIRNSSNLLLDTLTTLLDILYTPLTANIRRAVPFNTYPGGYIVDFPFSVGNRLFGDGNFSNENDSCLAGHSSGSQASSAVLTLVNDSNATGLVDVWMRDVCGLQNGDTAVVIRGPAPFRALRVLLPPDAANIQIAKDLPAAPGTWTFELDNSARSMPGNSLDDFTFSSMSAGWSKTPFGACVDCGIKIVN